MKNRGKIGGLITSHASPIRQTGMSPPTQLFTHNDVVRRYCQVFFNGHFKIL
ncbi:MAG: hypothetical protein LBB05_01175 [Puniceicoccales bacterium]|nr:hypothetical protein [Puniceicoccales bacterium]